MKVFLSGIGIMKSHPEQLRRCKYILESYWAIKPWQVPYLKNADMFLLDSGAFTFMKGTKTANWQQYIEQYAEYIKSNGIKYYFELDIDAVVGYKKTLEYRNTLERLTGIPCIPVWHKSRGKNEFIKMCEQYDFVAIGGIAIKDIRQKHYQKLKWFIDEAHKRGTIIHGLGFTSTTYYDQVKFDTVDSTTWNVGGKYGNICKFENGVMVQKYTPGKRCVNQQALMLHNYNEWLKFQTYADTHL